MDGICRKHHLFCFVAANWLSSISSCATICFLLSFAMMCFFFVLYVHWFLKEGFVHIKGREQVCDGTFDFQILHRRSHVRRAAKYKTTNYKAPMCTHSCARLGSFHIRIAELQNTVDKFKISTGYLIETNYRAATIRTSIHGFSLLYVCPRFDNSTVHCVIRRIVNHLTFY